MPYTSEKTTPHLIGGFVGGLTSALTLQPFDLLKTRLQQERNSTISKCLNSINHPLELWRGSLPSCLRTSVGSALYLTSLNVVRSKIANSKQAGQGTSIASHGSSNLPNLSAKENLLSGAFTRAFVGYLTMPITVIKVRFESTFYQYKTLKEAVLDIYRNHGMRGFVKGYGPTVARDAPYAGLYVLFYEKNKSFFPKYILPSNFIQTDPKTGKYVTSTATIVNTTSALFSAVLATTITAPFDTIKTRIQLQPNVNKNSIITIKNIIQKESIFNLFDGLSLRLIRKSLSAGIAWGIYEELIKKFLP